MSGPFRFDRTVKDAHPIILVHLTDVSLLSCALDALVNGGKFLLAFKGRLAVIEDLISDQRSTARVVPIEVALEMAKYKGPKPYAQAHFASSRSRGAFDIRKRPAAAVRTCCGAAV